MPRLLKSIFPNTGLALATFGVFLGISVAVATVSELAPSPSASTLMVTPPAGMDAATIAQPANMPADPAAAAMIRRGEYLATAGDCQYCHSIPGGTPFAGGQPLQTPFGDLFSPNITPDKHGIGGWTDAQFYSVMHAGISPGNSLLVFPRYLYPVMPWQDYSKLSYSDDMAIKAYLDSLAPSSTPSRASEIIFPFNIRAGLLSLRILSPSGQPMQYDPSWSTQVRNGAFLVQALAHCGECHTPRNILTITETSKTLSGASIPAQSWYAPNITSDPAAGTGAWSATDLFGFLYHSGSLGVAGGPYGPMKAVVEDSLSRLPASDVRDIVAYIQTAVPPKPDAPAGAVVANAATGAPLYSSYCARCHGNNGEGVNNNFPNLAGNQSVWSGPGNNVISMVLGGYLPWHQYQSAMPEFNQTLSNDEIASITNYIRTAWGNKGVADVTASQVGSERGVASDWSILSTATTQAGLTNGTTAVQFNDITGQVELFGDRANCMLNGSFETNDPAAPAKSIILAGACAKSGSTLYGTIMVDGTPHRMNLRFEEFIRGGHLSLLRISGTPEGTKLFFDARINLREPGA